jgi:endonuclease/exonuclease/phosphatase family metal-dependent hydrolase
MPFSRRAFIRHSKILIVFMTVLSYSASPADAMDNQCQMSGVSSSLPNDSVKLITLNISHGRNMAMNQLFVSKTRTYQNLDKIVALFDEISPDAVALQEADGPSRWSGNFNHVDYVANEADYPCIVHGLHSESWISNYGTALLSRSRPVDFTSVKFTPSWPSKQKGFVVATFDWSGEKNGEVITLVSVHFDFLRKSVRDQQVDEMVKHLLEVDGPLVLMGDLNSQWDQDNSHVRMLVDELDLHAFNPEQGGLGTYKDSTGKRLDWILISQNLEFREYKVLPDIVADHFAVFTEIAHRSSHE